MNNFRTSIFATFNVAVAISLAALAVYGASSLTPVPDRKTTSAQGSVAGISATKKEAIIVSGAKPLVFTATSGNYQIASQGETTLVGTSVLAGSVKVTRELVNIYNPNLIDLEVYVTVKVPAAIQHALSVDLIADQGNAQLFAPGVVTLPVGKVVVPAQASYILKTSEVALQPINFDSNLTYYLNSDF